MSMFSLTSAVARAKRKRIESADGDSLDLDSLQQHKTLWYDDGNAVLVAGQQKFRVHRSILARQSPVLATLFAEYPEETHRYIPLHDDPCEFTVVLNAVYEHRSSISVRQLEFRDVSAMFRLGSKYRIEWLREEALLRLQYCYPDTLAAYDKQVDRFSSRRPIKWERTQDYEVAILAYTHSLVPILTTALYECCTARPFELLNHLGHNEGSYKVRPQSVPYNREVIQKLFRAHSELIALRATKTFAFLADPSNKDCKSPEVCERAAREMAYEALYRLGLLRDSACALERQDEFIQEAHRKSACKSCIAVWKKRHEAGRKEVWGLLNMVFRIPEEID